MLRAFRQPSYSRWARTGIGALALLAATACLDDTPVDGGSPTIRATLHANVVGTVAGGTVSIRVGYRGGQQQFVVLRSSPERVQVAAGTTIVLPLTVDIGPCLADASRLLRAQDGCALVIELTLSDAAGGTIDSQTRDAREPVLPGESVNFGTVTIGVTVSSVVVTPSGLSLFVSQELPLTATVRDASGAVITSVPVAWTTTDATVAQLLTSTGASVTVRALKLGSATITATSGGRTSNEIRVNVAPPPPLVITQRQGAGCVLIGGTINLDVESPPGPVTWSSASPNVATVGATTGVVTGVAAGTSVLTATSGNRTGTATVCVTGPLRVIAPKQTIVAGETMTLTATGTSGGTLTFASSATSVATVDANGVVRGVGLGAATITATLRAASGSESVPIAITVNAASVAISPTSASAAVTRTARFTVVARDLAGATISGASATWTITDASVGRLSATTGSAVDVLALKVGSTVVRATVGGLSATAQFTATQAPIATVLQKVSGDGVTCPTRSTGCSFVVRTLDATGLPVPGASVQWSSSYSCGAPRLTTSDDAGLATSTNICSTVPSGSYNQIASLPNQQQVVFAFTLRGLVVTFQGYDSLGVAKFSVTAPGVTAGGLSAAIDYRSGPATNYIASPAFDRTTTPASLALAVNGQPLPPGNYLFDVVVSTTTPGLGPGMASIAFLVQSGFFSQPNVGRPSSVAPTSFRAP